MEKAMADSGSLQKCVQYLIKAVFLVMVCCYPALAERQFAEVTISQGGVYAAALSPEYNYMELRVVAPSGEMVFSESSNGSSISWSIPAYSPDGTYSWEVRLSTAPRRVRGEEGQIDSQARTVYTRSEVESGSFLIKNGSVVDSQQQETSLLQSVIKYGRLAANAISDFIVSPVSADQVIPDDLIIQSSECVGFDCVNGESFGFDTLRLKENNLRIKFQDTSTSASFPSNDWQITANDSSNGGANKFSIDDIDGGRTIFTLEAGAPAHSLYVDDGGRVGFGTSTPVVELHVRDGDTPTLRLEQDGSSGFTPQTWDVAGNETNFFVRDATNGSQLPFRIRPSAPSNSLYLDTDGDVGLGTASPAQKLHVANGNVFIDGTEAANDDDLTGSALEVIGDIRFDGTGLAGNTLEVVGNAFISGNLELGSSREIKNNITPLDEALALQTFARLEPVTFQYKLDPHENSVGFIAEEVPDLVATSSRKSISTMDVVAVMTKVVQKQQKEIEELSGLVLQLQAQFEKTVNDSPVSVAQ